MFLPNCHHFLLPDPILIPAILIPAILIPAILIPAILIPAMGSGSIGYTPAAAETDAAITHSLFQFFISCLLASFNVCVCLVCLMLLLMLLLLLLLVLFLCSFDSFTTDDDGTVSTSSSSFFYRLPFGRVPMRRRFVCWQRLPLRQHSRLQRRLRRRQLQ